MNEPSNFFILYVCVFLLVSVAYLFVRFFMRRSQWKREDLSGRNLPGIFRLSWRVLGCFTESVGRLLCELFPTHRRKLERALLGANVRMTPEHVLTAEVLFCATGAIVGMLLCMCVTLSGVFIASAGLLFGFIGFVWPSMTVYGAADRRQTALMRSLPFSIDLIGAAMRSGVDFTAAVRYYVSMEDARSPLAVEYGVMLQQLELGRTRTEAIEDMTNRIQSDSFRSFADAVIHGLEVGSSIVETMKIQAEEMRRVRFNVAERKAARAASAMIFPIAVFIMPAMFLILGMPVIMRVMKSGLGGLMR